MFRLALHTLVLMMTMFSGAFTREFTSDNRCRRSSEYLFCEDFIPDTIPNAISIVEISDSSWVPFIANPLFRSPSWKQVNQLSIKCSDENFAIYILPRNTFANLSNLTNLKISCKWLTYFEKNTFKGLDKVQVLDLSYCVRLTVSNMLPGLKKNKLKNLQILRLQRMGLDNIRQAVLFSESFFRTLKYKPIQELDLSDTRYSEMDRFSFSNSLPHLSSLNISRGGWLFVEFMLAYQTFGDGNSFNNLKSLDISYPIIRDEILTSNNSIYHMPFLLSKYNRPLNITTFIARSIIPHGYRVVIFGSILESSLCLVIYVITTNVNWTTICFSKSSSGIALEKIDLAENSIENIHESISKYFDKVKILDISQNRLYLMTDESFRGLTERTENLLEFYCSYNQLTSIPHLLFENTPKITIIDLSYNRLETVTVQLGHLRALLILKLNNNNIRTLYPSNKEMLDQLVFTSQPENLNNSSKHVLSVDLTSNPFECLCDNKEFVKWLMDSVTVDNLSYSFTCGLEGEQEPMDAEIISKIEEVCRRPTVIALSSITVVVFVITGIVIAIHCLRKRKRLKRQKHIKQIINKYKDRKYKNPQTVFVTHSSADDDFVQNYILDDMNKGLQKLLKTDTKCVMTGDTAFRPGFYVIEEMIKCIESCEVVVVCISESFCKSPWCKDELLISQYYRKPTVLMFLDYVDPKNMPKVLRSYFGKVARSKWIQENGIFRLQPNWDTVCESIVALMDAERTAAI